MRSCACRIQHSAWQHKPTDALEGSDGAEGDLPFLKRQGFSKPPLFHSILGATNSNVPRDPTININERCGL